jgi:hypothetical protein
MSCIQVVQQELKKHVQEKEAQLQAVVKFLAETLARAQMTGPASHIVNQVEHHVLQMIIV